MPNFGVMACVGPAAGRRTHIHTHTHILSSLYRRRFICSLRFRRLFINWILAGSTDFGLYDNDGSEDVFPNHPDDLELDWFLQENFSKVLDIATKIKNAGNGFFKNKDFDKAVKKYQKACRY
jgi:hypothetical protein